jgi:ribosomal protein L29
MKLANQQQAANTRVKLAALEVHYEKAFLREMHNEELKQLTLFSLRQMINQLKEELIRFECDVKAGRIENEATVL